MSLKDRRINQKLNLIPVKTLQVIKDTIEEDLWKGSYLRIYPSKTSDIYDDIFHTQKSLNKLVYKYLFTNEIINIEEPVNYPLSSFSKQKIVSPS